MNKGELSVQEYLSLGYIYLLVLGILSDTIYYRFLGINILEYSSVLDVLISPIAMLTENILIPICLLLTLGLMYLYTTRLAPRLHRKFRSRRWYQRMNNLEKLDRKFAQPASVHAILRLLAVLVLTFYLGIGIGRGNKRKAQIENKDVAPTHRLLFQDGSSERVKIVGKNSLYLFYLVENETELIIAPIEYNIQKITMLEENE